MTRRQASLSILMEGAVIIDARLVEHNSVLRSQVCIVGGGAAGITLARSLAAIGIDVCLLESGDRAVSWQAQDLYRARNVGTRYYALDMCQLRCLGGSTNAWGGWCRPLEPAELEPRPWAGLDGWPIPYRALARYYPRAAAVCQFDPLDYDPARWLPALARPGMQPLALDPATFRTTMYAFSPPTRFGRVYEEELGRARTLRCLLNANAVRIATDAAGGTASHVEVATFAGTRFRVVAEFIVLASGGVENARLLLNSDDVVAPGLGNQHDLVGRHFMEHPHTRRRMARLGPAKGLELYDGLRVLRALALGGDGVQQGGALARIALTEAAQQREGLLGYSANINTILLAHDTAGWDALRTLVLSLSDPKRQTDPFLRFPPFRRKGITAHDLWMAVRHGPELAAAAISELLPLDRLQVGFELESKSEQAPNPASRITLTGERDAFGMRRVQLDWRLLPLDRHTVLRAEELLGAELRRLGIGALAPLPAESERWPDNLVGGWHQLGTTRMAADPRRGVVNADCRVHGVRNLYAVGGSVFPTVGVAPPTLTIVALALRLAEHLADRLEARVAPVTVARERAAAATREIVASAPAADIAASPPAPV